MRRRWLLTLLMLRLLPDGSLVAGSPYRLDWSHDGWIAGGGAVLGVAAFAGRHGGTGLTPGELAQLNPASLNGFDRGAVRNYSAAADDASDWLVYGLIASPALFLAGSDVRDELGTLAVMYAEAMALTFTSIEVLKSSTQRIRPLSYHPGVPAGERTDPDARRSFPSSHTAFAFGSAVFLSTVYADMQPGSDWSPLLWGGTLLAASAVGTLRYAAGAHFPSDILAGALLGGAIGYLVPLVHRVDNSTMGVVFSSQHRGAGIRVVYMI